MTAIIYGNKILSSFPSENNCSRVNYGLTIQNEWVQIDREFNILKILVV